MITRSDSLSGLHEFENKLLLTFQKNEKIGNQGFAMFSFAWLDSLNRVGNVWEKDILSFQIIDSTLHYIKFNQQTKYWELHKISSDNINHTNRIITPNNIYINSFEYYSQNNTGYYFLNTNEGRKLILKQKNDSTDVSFIAWGNDNYFQIAIRDTFDNVYFQQKNGNDIRLFGLLANGLLSEKWSVSLQPAFVYADYASNYYIPAIRNMAIIGEKIVFNTLTGSYGINTYYFNVLDIKSNKNRRSRDLVDSFRWTYNTLKVSQLDTNTYQLDNGVGTISTYSFLADSIIKVTKYPYKSGYSSDSIFTVNQQKILLSDNIYNVSNASKIELIPSIQSFNTSIPNYFSYKSIGDKLLFWMYNPKLQKTELWVSNGEKKGSELLTILDGYFESYNKEYIKLLGSKLYFYTKDYPNILSIYETDGTKAGTNRIFKSDGTYPVITEWVKSNEKQIVYRLYGEKGSFIVIEDGKATLLSNFPVIRSWYEIYLTAKKTYLIVDAEKDGVTYYKIYQISNNTFELIDENVINRFVTYEDKLFYSKVNYKIINGSINFLQGYSGLYSIDANNKINTITNESVDYYGVYGDKLVYRQFVAENSPMKHTIIDLPTNRVDLVFNYYSYGISSINGALILSNEVKLLLIKDNQKREFEATNFIVPLGKGILMGDSKNLSYYDVLKNTVSPIVTDKQYETPLIGEKAKYMLIPTRMTDNTLSWSYWSVFNKKLTNLDYTGNFFQIDSIQALSSKQIGDNYEHSYWRFDGNVFFKSYELPKSNYLKSNTDNYYGTIFSKETGNELFQLGTENIVTFPEIIKGSEGIALGNVFHFNNQLYVYAFTYSYGWQVWKMSEGKVATPLSKEEEVENLVSVFPNPVENLLNIESQKTYRYRVINSKGQEVMQGDIIPQQVINFQNLAQGLYIIQFFDGQKTFSKKIVKY